MAAPPRDSIQLNRSDADSSSGSVVSSSDKRGSSIPGGSNLSLTRELSPLAVPPPADPKATVEQTVMQFRLFESLRTGDTAFITKALHSPNPPSNILHLAVQCATPQVLEFILSSTSSDPANKPESNQPFLDINTRDGAAGNTPLHLAAHLGRTEMVTILLAQPAINDTLPNYQNRLPLDLARTPAIHEKLQIARSVFIEETTDLLLQYIDSHDYDRIEALLNNERVRGALDLNTIEVSVTDGPPKSSGSGVTSKLHRHSHKNSITNDEYSGSTLLHEAARKKDTRLIQLLLYHGADPFRRDKRGKLPQDVTKDETTRGMLKRSPARVAAERGIEERVVLGGSQSLFPVPVARPGSMASSVGSAAALQQTKESREMKGYLKKWTNYTGGWKLRWFVLEDGVMSYYKNQEDVASACRGAINMRIAQLHMDPQDKTKFDIIGKSSIKYHLKANHVVEAKRWYWTLNNAIQWSKDEARSEETRKREENERHNKLKEQTKSATHLEASPPDGLAPGNSKSRSAASLATAPSDAGNDSDFYEVSVGGNITQASLRDEDDSDSRSTDSDEQHPPTADALLLSANSAQLQLDLLSQLSLALQFSRQNTPEIPLSDPSLTEIIESYDTAVLSLKQLVGDVVKISRDRDSYWKRCLDREVGVRRLWEENLSRLAHEQERLEGELGGQRERRRKTKRALKVALGQSQILSPHAEGQAEDEQEVPGEDGRPALVPRKSFAEQQIERELLADSESDEEDEFFDAIESGEVEVERELPRSPAVVTPKVERGEFHEVPQAQVQEVPVVGVVAEDGQNLPVEEQPPVGKVVEEQEETSTEVALAKSFTGYEKPPRTRLSKDSDDRPKVGLWGILKSMIGKDMTKMTLPVSFNECTSLLQRVAEDMEYTELLDQAVTRATPDERLVYVAAFAASEYASTLNRVAKPFNPLLGETYEYCSPQKGYRFMSEQVSHHPPIGAAYAEAERWTYWGESAVKSKFYGKSFDINPLGTWFLRLRPVSGGEELYTWKKVNTQVVGIITGSPAIDNYGLMEIRNHTTGDVATLDFKPRGWAASSYYQVKGKVCDASGFQKWSIGGRWNDKIYARHTPGSDADVGEKDKSAFLVWEVNPRPPAPFNLTRFAIGLNELKPELKQVLPPTDTRLRPDQRAMEEGEYDFAADEKHRLEEKQRAKRREREQAGEVYRPRWFTKEVDPVTGEEYWKPDLTYWRMRSEGRWEGVPDIF
ncbi:hypothetical protein BJ508DRAFT_142328 [Ascobolus immersus RN42]|uniref:PH domain-containing protein n=1 Tax=Ascobolus immersus RN42 TaxID=1160509 RepID=A0A3N4I584_ASCIM|nr:hypothetical protein BJ508DRAFT_142328 [Ascobolus immersus RN42]